MEVIIIYSLMITGLGYSFYKDRQKTKKAFIVARKAFKKILPSLLIIIGLVGLLLGFIPPETINLYLGQEAGFTGTVLAAVVGAITLIPSIISLPLAGSILRSGAAVMTIAAFITTLTMVGVVTLPIEIKELGKRFAFLRNTLSFLFALIIALIMGVIFP